MLIVMAEEEARLGMSGELQLRKDPLSVKKAWELGSLFLPCK